MPTRHKCLNVLMVLSAALPASAQEARPIANGPPISELPYEFSQVHGVLEMRDGRVLVLDRLEGNVRLADLRTGVSAVLGRLGEGPGEYRAAHELVPLGGDSVGIVDGTLPRILVITRTGELGGFVSPYSNHPETKAMLSIRAGDGRGWFYGNASSLRLTGDGTLQLTDSAAIMRWKPATEPADLVARYYSPPPAGSRATASGSLVHTPGTVAALSPSTVWVVGADGRVAVVSGAPYQVQFIETDGRRRIGPVIPFAKVAINDSIKNAYQSDMSRPQMTVVVDGGRTTTERSVPPLFRITNWASEVPPFRGGAFIAFAPNGELWIQRTTFRREGARYDVIGPGGSLVDRVRLPEGHRVVGFGRDGMYVVRRDADDLEFVQRRALLRR